MSEDNQLRAARFILGYEPLSHIYQDAGQAIRAGNPRLTRIDVSKPRFLARRDLPLVVLPVQQNLPLFMIPIQQVPFKAAAIAAEEIASSSRLSLEEEIDKFRFEEEERTPEKLVKLSDSKTKSDKLSTAHQPELTIALVYTSSEEGEEMDLKKRPSLRGLIANRNKGANPTEILKAQVSANLPPPPTDLKLYVNPDLKKKRPMQELEEGEVASQKGTK